MCRCATSTGGRSTMAETRSLTGVDVTVANFEIENNWESELCSLILVKLHIRFVVFGSSAWSSETEVSEPAADCGVLDRSPRPRRRELRAEGSGVRPTRCNPGYGVFQGSSGLSNRGSGKFRRQVRDGRSQCPGRPCRYRTSEVHASIIETSYRDLATRA